MDELIAFLPFLQKARVAENAWWAPDRPPPTVLAARLGREVVGGWRELKADQKTALSSAIERAATSRDEMLGTVVLTGLVEAMLNRAQSDECSEKDILDFLGVNARRHAVGWMSFYGCPTYGYRS